MLLQRNHLFIQLIQCNRPLHRRGNQLPEFILDESPKVAEFLKQYYISQEFQSSSIDLAENLIEYKNVDTFDNVNLIVSTTLTSDVGFFDDVINVNSSFKNGNFKELINSIFASGFNSLNLNKKDSDISTPI